MSTLGLILVVLLILALVGAIPGYRSYGYVGASPVLVVVVIFIILWLAGVL